MSWWAASIAWTKGSQARVTASWLGKHNRRRRFHGLLTESDLVGAEIFLVSRTALSKKHAVRRDGNKLILDLSSLSGSEARDVIAQLRIEGLEQEVDDGASST